MLPHLSEYFTVNEIDPGAFTLRLHSPGRINIIGEHTDYTGGWVMPASIAQGIEFYARPLDRPVLRLHAVDLRQQFELALPVSAKTGTLWVDYLAGITDQFQHLDHEVPGLEIVFGGDVPRGSGMSSSAALEGGMAFLLNEVLQANLSRPALAQLCQRSSNNFIGIPSGIMDQFASLNGTANGPIMLNCDSLEFSVVNANLTGYSWLLVNSMVSHELTGSEYPDRVRQCAEALDLIQKEFPDVDFLSNATQEQYEAVKPQMKEVVRQRAHHIITENQRVNAAAAALAAGDATKVGELLNETHRSLRDDFEVSCTEVDFLQATANNLPPGAIAGSRIMGGGFGGCTINLVKTEALSSIKEHLTAAYQEAYGLQPEFYDVVISSGTRLI